ncbi:MAG: hypothetical protein ACLFVN_08850 [Phycisphaeraceae bacterium]
MAECRKRLFSVFASGLATGVITCLFTWVTLMSSGPPLQTERVSVLVAKLKNIDLGIQSYRGSSGRAPDAMKDLVPLVPESIADDFVVLSTDKGAIVIPKYLTLVDLTGGRGESPYGSIAPGSNFFMVGGRLILFDRKGQVTTIDVR